MMVMDGCEEGLLAGLGCRMVLGIRQLDGVAVVKSRSKVEVKYRMDGCLVVSWTVVVRHQVFMVCLLVLKRGIRPAGAGSCRTSPKSCWRVEQPRNSARNRQASWWARVGALTRGASSELCTQVANVASRRVGSLARGASLSFCTPVTNLSFARHVGLLARSVLSASRAACRVAGSWGARNRRPSRCFWQV